jgi:hypothetical protein
MVGLQYRMPLKAIIKISKVTGNKCSAVVVTSKSAPYPTLIRREYYALIANKEIIDLLRNT